MARINYEPEFKRKLIQLHLEDGRTLLAYLKNRKSAYNNQKQTVKKEIINYYHRYNGVLGYRMMKLLIARKKISVSNTSCA